MHQAQQEIHLVVVEVIIHHEDNFIGQSQKAIHIGLLIYNFS